MKIGLIGSVRSSLITLEKLVQYHFDIVGVWGYEVADVTNISDYCSLREFAELHNLRFYPFQKVNDVTVKSEVMSAKLDVLFVVGLSQLVDMDIIRLPRLGCVGFHPTKLPRGRGRAPLAWLVLKEKEGAATFFKIEENADCGMIHVQEPFKIVEEDDVTSVVEKLEIAMKVALDKWLPCLLEENLFGKEQDEREVTCYAKRTPVDGCIDWGDEAKNIDRLVKATSRPYPGAYSFWGNCKVVIWRSRYRESGFPVGVVGRVVGFNGTHPVVQTGDGFLEIIDHELFADGEVAKGLSVGNLLGYHEQLEIYKLKREVQLLKEQLNHLLDEK